MDSKPPHGADSAPEPAIDAELAMHREASEDAEEVAIFDERIAPSKESRGYFSRYNRACTLDFVGAV